ncbi:DUF305 domain-containing protein [Pontibacter amylolyticus]|uniref:DUF305 domain-containing protein n=1 Tax=Pontibacter amylolyticus TaxID=1424080 RepID=A0ABQ1VY40_9BACT|nr:DUF305 domain-containing protein [Pontibacter amylolyticus]GGG04970.1 hypothetical protein GCM10011323_07180 [Pontibacter amylolyticus]
MEKGNYGKFMLMLGLSFVVMYAVMFSNIAEISHFDFNLNRLYMTILMVAPMALIMLLVMRPMYRDKKLNTIITVMSIIAIVGSFITLRNQSFVGDKAFINSMIPHHSSAILVSEEARIHDPELKKLAEEIIRSQKEEIAEMEKIRQRID